MRQAKGKAAFVTVVAMVLMGLFLLGGCGSNPVSSTPTGGGSATGGNGGKGSTGGNVAASAAVPADSVFVPAAN